MEENFSQIPNIRNHTLGWFPPKSPFRKIWIQLEKRGTSKMRRIVIAWDWLSRVGNDFMSRMVSSNRP